jgi:serine/threonine protein kinase
MTPCPPDETLHQFLAGALSGRDAEVVCGHVRTCPGCAALLDDWSDSATLRGWRPQGTPAPEEGPALHRVVRSLQDLRAGADTEDSPAEEPERPLPFLGLPRQPGDLGTLGPYRVLAELGRGGTGVVLKAHDEALGRSVALKVLRPELATPAARSRLLREARCAARFRHDHVVTVHAVVDPPDGLPYLVLEYLAGPTLAERVRSRQPLPPREAAALAAQVADALAAAHAAGLLHRDVKPGNVLLDAATGRAKLVDFGLARVAEQASGLTREGHLAGTPAYMSPEQVRRPEAVDARADIYGLGATLYELLTGEPPFRGTTALIV